MIGWPEPSARRNGPGTQAPKRTALCAGPVSDCAEMRSILYYDESAR